METAKVSCLFRLMDPDQVSLVLFHVDQRQQHESITWFWLESTNCACSDILRHAVTLCVSNCAAGWGEASEKAMNQNQNKGLHKRGMVKMFSRQSFHWVILLRLHYFEMNGWIFFFFNIREGPVFFSLTQLVLILLTEAVSSREEVPASLLVHLPHEGLLQTKENRFPDVKICLVSFSTSRSIAGLLVTPLI